eukprot:scaffold178358_cov15-Tisochrysis_lutea.AAC.1
MLMHRKLKWMSGVNVAMDCEVGLARRGQRATAWANSRLGGRVEERCTPCNALLHANSVGKVCRDFKKMLVLQNLEAGPI